MKGNKKTKGDKNLKDKTVPNIFDVQCTGKNSQIKWSYNVRIILWVKLDTSTLPNPYFLLLEVIRVLNLLFPSSFLASDQNKIFFSG